MSTMLLLKRCLILQELYSALTDLGIGDHIMIEFYGLVNNRPTTIQILYSVLMWKVAVTRY